MEVIVAVTFAISCSILRDFDTSYECFCCENHNCIDNTNIRLFANNLSYDMIFFENMGHYISALSLFGTRNSYDVIHVHVVTCSFTPSPSDAVLLIQIWR